MNSEFETWDDIEEKPKFEFSTTNKILIAIACLLRLLPVLAADEVSAYEIGRFIGAIMIFTLIPSLIAWVCWICSNRKKEVGNVVCNVVLVLTMIAVFRPGPGQKREMEKVEEMQRRAAAFNKKIASTTNPAEITALAKEHMASMKADFGDLARNSVGEKKQAYTILRTFMDETGRESGRWMESYTALMSLDVFDYSTLTSDEEFDRRRSAVEVYVKESKSYLKYHSSVVRVLGERLMALGPGNRHAASIMKGARDKFRQQKPVFVPLMQTHISSGETMLRILDILKENKGQWSLEDGQLLFESDSVLSEFNNLCDKLIKEEETIEALSKKLN